MTQRAARINQRADPFHKYEVYRSMLYRKELDKFGNQVYAERGCEPA
jgi:hypothetical protein